MSFDINSAVRAPFWKRFNPGLYGAPGADLAKDNGFQDKVFDPAGNAMNLAQFAGTGRGRTHFNNPNGVSADGQLSTASAPTVTPTGGSASTWAYKIVARASNGTGPASTAGQTTTGAATLTSSAFNTITWSAVTNAVSYDIYRTTVATSPSTTGYIGNVLAGATLSFTDTGIAADSSTAPTVNTTGVFECINAYDLSIIGLAAVQNTTITNGGTAGSTAYSYRVSAVTAAGTENASAAAASTATGNATLSSTNYNTITFKPVPGAKTYNVYRSASAGTPGTTGLIASVTATSSATTVTVNDTGLTASGSVPTANNTGTITSTGAFYPSAVVAGTVNYIASETGANNAIAGALTNASGTAVTLAAGLGVIVKLAHTLQAGANTFNLNAGGAVAIKSSRNVANNIGTAYASTGVITLLYDGTQWLDMSQ